jgi:hypothetical protein
MAGSPNNLAQREPPPQTQRQQARVMTRIHAGVGGNICRKMRPAPWGRAALLSNRTDLTALY